MMSFILNLLFSFILGLAFTGTGYAFVRKILKEELSCLESIIFSFALGYGIYGSIVFVLGILGFLNVKTFIVLLSIGLLLFAIYFRFFFSSAKKARSFYVSITGDAFSRVMVFTVIAIFLVNTFINMAPITSMDGLVYHYALPKQYLGIGQVFNYKGYLYAHTPQLALMINAFAMGLRSDICAALLNSYLGLMMTGLIFCSARRFFDIKIALLAAVLFYAMPLTTWEVTGSFVDIHLAFFCILSLYTMVLYFKDYYASFLLLSGFFMGIALSIKVLGLMYFVLLSVILVAVLIKKKSVAFLFRGYVLWFLAIVVLGSHWYIFNYVTTGNPFFPLFYKVFGGEHWNATTDAIQFSALNQYGYGKSIKAFLLLPFNLLVKGAKFDHGELIGPLLFVFSPIAFFSKKHFKESVFLALFVLLFVIMWFSKSQQTRFLIPVLPLLCILSAIGFYVLSDHTGRILKALTKAAVICFLVFSLLLSVYFARQFAGVVTGHESRDEFLTRMVWGYKCSKWINDNLDKRDKLLIRRYGSYYLDIPYIEGDYVVQGFIDYSKFSTPADLTAKFKEMNITHVYLYEEVLPTDNKKLWLNFIDGQDLIYEDIDNASSSRARNLGDIKNKCRVYKLR